jgi:hypothetical protein
LKKEDTRKLTNVNETAVIVFLYFFEQVEKTQKLMACQYQARRGERIEFSRDDKWISVSFGLYHYQARQREAALKFIKQSAP